MSEPKYNGWVVTALVLTLFIAEDWIMVSVLFLIILYVGWIEYLRMKYRLALREKK